MDFVPPNESFVQYRAYINSCVFRGDCSPCGRIRFDLDTLRGIVGGSKVDINYFAPVGAGLLAEGGHIGLKFDKRGVKESRQDEGQRMESDGTFCVLANDWEL